MPRVAETCSATAARSSGSPWVGPVLGESGVERPLAGLDNVRRSGEIGFADFHVNDVAALRFELAGADQDLESALPLKLVRARCRLHGRIASVTMRAARSAGPRILQTTMKMRPGVPNRLARAHAT